MSGNLNGDPDPQLFRREIAAVAMRDFISRTAGAIGIFRSDPPAHDPVPQNHIGTLRERPGSAE